MELVLLLLGLVVAGLVISKSGQTSEPPDQVPRSTQNFDRRPIRKPTQQPPKKSVRGAPPDDLRLMHETSLPKGTAIRGRCWVIDGDTIVIGDHRIRLAGIDAPELDHPWGRKAKSALIDLCRGQVVTATVTGEFSHSRLVAECHLQDGRDLSAELVKQGLALDWRKYSGGRYRSYEPEGVRKRLWRADARQKGRFPPDQAQR